MNTLFYLNAAIAVFTTALVIFAKNPVHALIYLIASFLSVAFAICMLGAPFAAALEVIVYAGAIMVLFVFVVMLLNLSKTSKESLVRSKTPFLVALLLLVDFYFVLGGESTEIRVVSAKEVSQSLFTTYGLGVELASFLLLAGLIGAYHISQKKDV